MPLLVYNQAWRHALTTLYDSEGRHLGTYQTQNQVSHDFVNLLPPIGDLKNSLIKPPLEYTDILIYIY